MNDLSIRNPAWESMTNQQFSEIDELCDRFDQELMNGKGPRIETFLAEAPQAAWDGLLAELLAMEIEYRMRQGDDPHPDEYLLRFQQQENVVTGVFAQEATTQFPGGDSATISVDVPGDLGKFRLIKELGRGGMGVVWLAEQTHPVKRRVALKLIKSELASADVITRFENEKQALAMMDHPHIARVLDAGTTGDGRPYFVMELIDGIPITQYCDEKKLSVDERLKLFVSVCKAVQHAHHKGIIHRDLKPSNVLVTVIDGEAVPKVIDFGLAKAVAQDLHLSDVTMRTEFGKVVGTVQYMSPEQAELKGVATEDIDTRTDIYSLGVMLYELLTGSTPLEKGTLARVTLLKVLEIIREEEPPRPSNRLSSTSSEAVSKVGEQRRTLPAKLKQLLQGELDWVVMKSLEKDRARRYQAVNDLAQDVANYLSGDAVAARPPSTWYQLQKFAKRNRGLVTALLAIGVVLLAGIAGTSYGLIRATEETRYANVKTTEAEQEREKAKASEQQVILEKIKVEQEKKKVEANGERAIKAEAKATAEADRARLSEAKAKFQLANARWDARRARDARDLLNEIPPEYRDTFEWNFCNRKFEGSDFTCYGHQERIGAVAFSPDGARIATASDDSTVKIWDAKSGQELHTLRGHRGWVTEVIFSRDGTHLASTGSDKTIKIWDVQTGRITTTLKGNNTALAGMTFTPNGEQLVSVSGQSTVKRWDVRSGRIISTVGQPEAITNVAFSPNATRYFACGPADIILRDVATGEEIARRSRAVQFARSVAFSPDGLHIAVAGHDLVQVWDAELKQKLWAGDGKAGWIDDLNFSPDGTRLATSGGDRQVHVWDVRTGLELMVLAGHGDEVYGVAFSPDGARLASVGLDKTLKVWDARTGRKSITRPAHLGNVCGLVFSRDGKRLVSVSADRTIKLWDVETRREIGNRKGFYNADAQGTCCVAFSRKDEYIAFGDSEKSVQLLDGQTGALLKTFQGHEDWICSVAFDPTGKRLVSGSRDHTARVWDVETGEEICTLKGHKSRVNCVTFSPDGTVVASASEDNTIKLWDVETGREIRSLSGHLYSVVNIAFHPNGHRIASSSNSDHTIRIWDTKSGTELSQLNGHTAGVVGIAFNSDGSRLVSTGFDRTLKLWDPDSSQEVTTLDLDSHVMRSVAFSPDGLQLAVGTDHGTLKFLDAPTEHEVITLRGHTDAVLKFSFSKDGQRVYSESRREKLVWDLATKEVISDAAWEPPHMHRHPFLSPDGRYQIQADRNNLILVDVEYKNTPREKTYRAAKVRFDPVWHIQQATTATTEANWYAAVLHYAYLRKNDPASTEYTVPLHSSFRRLVAHNSEDVETLSKLTDSTGETQGTFYTNLKLRTVTTLPASPYNLTEQSDHQATENSPFNHALFFDGSSYAHLGNVPFYQTNFTVEGWIKPRLNPPVAPTQPLGSGTIFTLRPDEKNTAIAVELSNGFLRVIHRNPPGGGGGIVLFSQSKVTDGKWHHFAVVKDEVAKLHVYIDGKLEATSPKKATDFQNVPSHVYLGMNIKQNPRYYSGLIDDVRLWKTARTKEEIYNGMKSQVDSETPGLVVTYDFNQSPPVPLVNSNFHTSPAVVESLKLLNEPR